MITPEQCDKLDEWRKYFVYGETEEGGYCVKGLKKNTPKKIIKEFKAWYKETYPETTDEENERIPNI